MASLQELRESQKKKRDVYRYIKDNKTINFGEFTLNKNSGAVFSFNPSNSIESIIANAKFYKLIEENEFEEWNLTDKGEKELNDLENKFN